MHRRRPTSSSRSRKSLNNNNLASTVIGIIPVRYASSRLLGKPLLELCGKPIIQHVYERAKQAKLLNDVIVATDDDRIAAVVERIRGRAVMTPTTIRSGSDRVAYTAKNLKVDIVANIQGDEPLINPEVIDETVRPLLEDRKIDVCTPVKKITSTEELANPNIVKVVFDSDGFALYFSRSPIPHVSSKTVPSSEDGSSVKHGHYKHIGLYVYRKDFLLTFTQWDPSPLERAEQLEQLRILEHGHRIKCVVTEHDSFSVDTLEDFEQLKRMMVKN